MKRLPDWIFITLYTIFMSALVVSTVLCIATLMID